MFTNINELIELPEMVKGGFITARPHPTHPLVIYNYTAKTQYERVWNEATLSCRGLIADDRGNVVARPLRKFFNLSEVAELPNEPFRVYEKMDGSLMVQYWINGQPFVASRGSFDSQHAKWGKEILRLRYLRSHFDPHCTYLFELIHPFNRIVVDYRGLKDLILLAVIETKTGKEMNLDEYSDRFHVPLELPNVTDVKSLCNLDWKNTEGFVIRFESGFRVKVKLEEYLRLHKLLTGISEKTILEDWLMKGESIEPLLDRVPDEFADWVKKTVYDFSRQFTSIEESAYDVFEAAPKETRKDFALFAKETDLSSILFNMLDDRPHKQSIWKMIQADTKKFRCEE